jgi:hypothetical protein
MSHSNESDVGSGGDLGSLRSGPLDGEIFQKRVKNKDQIILHPATRDWVEYALITK